MRRTKQPGTTICSVRLPVSQVYTYRNEKHNSKALSTSCTTRDRMYSVRKSTVAFCLLCYSFGAAHCYSNTPIKPADDVSKMPENVPAPSKLPWYRYTIMTMAGRTQGGPPLLSGILCVHISDRNIITTGI